MDGAGTKGAGAGRVIEDGAILIEKDVIVPLIDGHCVSCNVFRPNRTGRFPPIIAFTPYGKDSDVAVDFKRYWDFVLRDHPDVVQGESSGKYLTWEVPDPERWVPAGYAIVVVDARGTGKSPGYYELMGALQTRDVYDVIEWAAVQPWSNRKVGMLGVSYLAIKQWQVAALQPPHLAAMIPWEGMLDHYRDFFRHGGIFSSFFMKLLWDSQIAVNQNGNGASPYRDRFTGERSTGTAIDPQVLPGNLSNLFETGLQHRFDDAYFRTRTPQPERIKVPFLSAGNWGGLGLHLRGNVIAFEQAASAQKWLEMHTDTHFASMYLAEAVALQRAFLRSLPERRGQWVRAGAAGPAHHPRSARFRPPQGSRMAARAHAVGPLRARCVDPGAAPGWRGRGRGGRLSGARAGCDVPQRAVCRGHRVHRATRGETLRRVVDDRHGPVPDAARVRSAGRRGDVQGRERSAGAGVAGLAARLAAPARSGAVDAVPAVPSA